MKSKIKTDEWTISIGQKIKKLRIEKGYSLEQIAELSGRKLQYIKRAENGGKYSTINDYIAIADVLQIDACELFF